MKHAFLLGFSVMMSASAFADTLTIDAGMIKKISDISVASSCEEDLNPTTRNEIYVRSAADFRVELKNLRAISFRVKSPVGVHHIGNQFSDSVATLCDEAREEALAAAQRFVLRLHSIHQGNIAVDRSTQPRTCYRQVLDAVVDSNGSPVEMGAAQLRNVVVRCP